MEAWTILEKHRKTGHLKTTKKEKFGTHGKTEHMNNGNMRNRKLENTET